MTRLADSRGRHLRERGGRERTGNGFTVRLENHGLISRPDCLSATVHPRQLKESLSNLNELSAVAAAALSVQFVIVGVVIESATIYLTVC